MYLAAAGTEYSVGYCFVKWMAKENTSKKHIDGTMYKGIFPLLLYHPGKNVNSMGVSTTLL